MSKKENFYVDIHVIQTVPPSCVNRDDTGSPKQCIYGGVRRARVSSQSWKRAVRVAFRDMYATDELANRTKNIVSMVAEQIKILAPEADAEKLAINVLESADIKINTKDPSKGTDALFFMSFAQAKALAGLAILTPAHEEEIGTKEEKDEIKKKNKVSEEDYKKKCRDALKDNASIDLALFGRMVANVPSLNYDAAAMVAHAISTHKVQTEFDYFTAVDDLIMEDSSGAGHLGTVEFNSSTLYRYASININELADNLDGDTAKAVRNFVEAFLLSMPTGKITTFANRSLPNGVYITVRNDQPVNMATAFESPVHASEDGGYIEASKNALSKYANSVYASFVNAPVKSWTIGENMNELGVSGNLKTTLEELETFIGNALTEGN